MKIIALLVSILLLTALACNSPQPTKTLSTNQTPAQPTSATEPTPTTLAAGQETTPAPTQQSNPTPSFPQQLPTLSPSATQPVTTTPASSPDIPSTTVPATELTSQPDEEDKNLFAKFMADRDPHMTARDKVDLPTNFTRFLQCPYCDIRGITGNGYTVDDVPTKRILSEAVHRAIKNLLKEEAEPAKLPSMANATDAAAYAYLTHITDDRYAAYDLYPKPTYQAEPIEEDSFFKVKAQLRSVLPYCLPSENCPNQAEKHRNTSSHEEQRAIYESQRINFTIYLLIEYAENDEDNHVRIVGPMMYKYEPARYQANTIFQAELNGVIGQIPLPDKNGTLSCWDWDQEKLTTVTSGNQCQTYNQ